MKARTIVAGCGAGMLLMLRYLWHHLSPYHLALYHSSLPDRTVVWGLLIDLAVADLLATLLFFYLEKRDPAGRSIVWALVAATLSLVLVSPALVIPYLSTKTEFTIVLVAALAFRRLLPCAYQAMTRGLLVLFLLAGCSTVWMAPELLYLALRQPGGANEAAGVMHAARFIQRSDPPGGGRILWLLFDELSYDQTFAHRFPGLSLPAFDEVKRAGVLFDDLNPAGYYTEDVIPSLILGKTVDNAKSNLDGDLQVRIAGQKGWRGFDAQATIFADAQRGGWATGLAGWYNPYCRILAGTLDYCFWRMSGGQFDGMLPDQSVLTNALAPVLNEVRELEHKPSQQPGEDLAAIVQQGQSLIRNQDVRFIFIHLPVPHPAAFYDRKTGLLRAGGSYIDNLALADRSLGELMATLKTTALAPKTTVIICSDHSWRVGIWRAKPDWTSEDEAASHGRFNPHPMLMIHFPGQSSGVGVKQPFDEIRLHDLIQGMLRGKLNSPIELQAWLKANAQAISAQTAVTRETSQPSSNPR